MQNQYLKMQYRSMIKLIVSLSFLVLFATLSAQEKTGFIPEITASQGTFVSSGKDLPFWMTANSNGVFTLHNSTYLLFQAGLKRGFEPDSLRKWGYTYGANMVYGLAGGSDFHPNEYWIGLRFHSLILKAGAVADPVIYAGLSSTNGNMYRSRNARPVPGISVSSKGFIPFLFGKRWLTFRFQFEEGILKDKQAVTDAHLHHKSMKFKGILSPSVTLSGGFEHYVFWGGTTPVYGQQPGLSEYFRYILGMKGGGGATVSDQINVAGNGLGSWNMEFMKDWTSVKATLYWNHPFEDRSGMELVNIQDGLWGLHVEKKKRDAFITDIVYEYMYTLNQSGSYHMKPAPTPERPNRMTGRGMDNYFNHGLYTSGFTHYQRMMGTPLFVPEIGTDGISTGFESTRMWMHHIGLSGVLGRGFSWKSMMTWSRNFGNYSNIYANPLDELSFIAECVYATSKLPFDVKVGAASDYGDRFEHRYGGYLGIGFRF
jgi:hypothetical protein